jgi:hypothetical protein
MLSIGTRSSSSLTDEASHSANGQSLTGPLRGFQALETKTGKRCRRYRGRFLHLTYWMHRILFFKAKSALEPKSRRILAIVSFKVMSAESMNMMDGFGMSVFLTNVNRCMGPTISMLLSRKDRKRGISLSNLIKISSRTSVGSIEVIVSPHARKFLCGLRRKILGERHAFRGGTSPLPLQGR